MIQSLNYDFLLINDTSKTFLKPANVMKRTHLLDVVIEPIYTNNALHGKNINIVMAIPILIFICCCCGTCICVYYCCCDNQNI